MKALSRIQLISERKPVHPDTIRGHARQISACCVGRALISQLEAKFGHVHQQIKNKKARLKIVRTISDRVKASICANNLHPQAKRADWLVFVSDGDGAVDIVQISVSLKPKKTVEFSVRTISSFSKHSLERLVERWRIRSTSELVETIKPALNWVRHVDSFLPSDSTLFHLPLPEGLLCLRKNADGEVPVIVTAIDNASFSQETEMQWKSLSNNGALFDCAPAIFKDSDELSIRHLSELLMMSTSGMFSDTLKNLRQLPEFWRNLQ